jgi:hypothetical protein
MAVLPGSTLRLTLGPAMTRQYDAGNIDKSERQNPPDGGFLARDAVALKIRYRRQ